MVNRLRDSVFYYWGFAVTLFTCSLLPMDLVGGGDSCGGGRNKDAIRAGKKNLVTNLMNLGQDSDDLACPFKIRFPENYNLQTQTEIYSATLNAPPNYTFSIGSLVTNKVPQVALLVDKANVSQEELFNYTVFWSPKDSSYYAVKVPPTSKHFIDGDVYNYSYLFVPLSGKDIHGIDYEVTLIVPQERYYDDTVSEPSSNLGKMQSWWSVQLYDAETVTCNNCITKQFELRGFAARKGSSNFASISGASGDSLGLTQQVICDGYNFDRKSQVFWWIADCDLFKRIQAGAVQGQDSICDQLCFCPLDDTQSCNPSVATCRSVPVESKDDNEVLTKKINRSCLQTRSGISCADVSCDAYCSQPSCLQKVVKQFLAKGNLSAALQLLVGSTFSTASVLCDVNSPADACLVGSLLTGLLYEHPWTFETLGSIGIRDTLFSSSADFQKGVCILKAAFEAAQQRDLCNPNSLSRLCKLILLAAPTQGLIGAVLCALAAGGACGSIDTDLICKILACLRDLPDSITFSTPDYGYEIEPLTTFATEVCAWFSCMSLNPAVTDLGSVSLLAAIMIKGFTDITGDCASIVQKLIQTVCDQCDGTELIAQALPYAQKAFSSSVDQSDFAQWVATMLTSV